MPRRPVESYLKLHTGWLYNDKVLGLSMRGKLVHLSAMLIAKSHAYESGDVTSMLTPSWLVMHWRDGTAEQWQAAIDECVAAGCLDRDDECTAVHNWRHHQETKEAKRIRKVRADLSETEERHVLPTTDRVANTSNTGDVLAELSTLSLVSLVSQSSGSPDHALENIQAKGGTGGGEPEQPPKRTRYAKPPTDSGAGAIYAEWCSIQRAHGSTCHRMTPATARALNALAVEHTVEAVVQALHYWRDHRDDHDGFCPQLDHPDDIARKFDKVTRQMKKTSKPSGLAPGEDPDVIADIRKRWGYTS